MNRTLFPQLQKRCIELKRILSLFLALLLLVGAAAFTPPAKASNATKLIAITFDDGPGPYTEKLLDGLKERGVKATFFMVGTRVAGYPAIVARVYQEGHQVANHSYNHAQLTTLSSDGVKGQIQQVNDLLDKACGKGSTYMVRPPYGSVNNTVSQAVNAPLIIWSVDPLDWKYRNAETVKNNIIRQAHDGAIVLAHDIHATTIPGALAAIDELMAQGYEFVTVQELFRRRGVTPENGVRYSQVAPNGEDLGPVAAPTITAQPEGDQLRITITAQSGADIYYTTSGGDLNQESSRYTGPFLASTPCTVKAVAAFNMNGSRSEATEESFTMPVVAAPEVYITDGLLTMTCVTPSTDIYYALQGGNFQRYADPVPVPPGTEVSAYAQRAGYLTSSITRVSYSSRQNLFRDVFPDQWYYDGVDWAVSSGYLTCAGGDLFDPSGALERGQLLVLLYRHSGETAEAGAVWSLPFSDVPKDAYYAEATAWAYGKGIVGGSDSGLFEPTRTATHQEICTILLGYLRTLDVALPEGTGAAGLYADRDEIEPWASEAVEIMTAIGLLSGDGSGRFAPAAGADRAQAAVMLMRLDSFVSSQRSSAPEETSTDTDAPEQGGI